MTKLTLHHTVITKQVIELSEDEISDVTSRWSGGEHEWVIDRLALVPVQPVSDLHELFSPIWYAPESKR